MALKIHLFPRITLLQSPRFQSYLNPNNRPKTQILCTTNNKKNSLNDADLASDLATEVTKINTHLLQKEEAMNKSKQLLFTEFCQYLASKEEQVKQKWKEINEEDKCDLVKGFVNEWSANFHPLSARSVQEMLEEYLQEEKKQSSSTSANVDVMFPGLKRMMGIS